MGCVKLIPWPDLGPVNLIDDVCPGMSQLAEFVSLHQFEYYDLWILCFGLSMLFFVIGEWTQSLKDVRLLHFYCNGLVIVAACLMALDDVGSWSLPGQFVWFICCCSALSLLARLQSLAKNGYVFLEELLECFTGRLWCGAMGLKYGATDCEAMMRCVHAYDQAKENCWLAASW
ncbi:hypothetical protein Nepgr_009342 [Nepenthes gracilis]|uniref:Uncharacterized protein n=1 Tax=Nepenthes gracilis TaxID=150966 RepID=A0AAD3SB78_NEPGR|nr:hypothetical protein Nepgr_009342 [Nepenthes gracilis]